MQTSTNLGLNLIEGTDNVDISKVTDNFATLDTEVAKVATTSAAGRMSATDKEKLDGIAAGANNYVHPSGDGNSHVPATGTTNNGKVLKAGATAGSAAWNNVAFSELTGTAGAANDTVIGNRAIDDTVAASAGADTPTRLWSKLGNIIKAITGNANWYTAPATTLEAANTHIADNVRHITSTERTAWNAKETPSGAQSKADAAAATVQGGLDSHLANKANPHAVTKSQVGLGSVDNYATATQAQAEAGSATNLFMTPLRTKQYVDKRLLNNLQFRMNAGNLEYNDGGTWKVVGNIPLGKLRTASLNYSGTGYNSYVTVVNISGTAGRLEYAVTNSSQTGGTAYNYYMKVTMDGLVDEVMMSGNNATVNYLSRIYGGSNGLVAEQSDALYFNDSLKIEIKTTTSIGIGATVKYRLKAGTA